MNKTYHNLTLFGAACLLLSLPAWAGPDHDHDANETGHKPAASEAAHTHSAGEDHGQGEDHEKEGEHAHDEEGGHGEEGGHAHGGEGHDEDNVVKLDATQQQLGGIRVSALQPARIRYSLYAPGEVQANGYTSTVVSPRVDSVVLSRHVALGDHVKAGQPLVTLFSETVAEAQAAWLVADAEWQRVKKLGRKAVGEKRWVSARADHQAAVGRLQAYGVSSERLPAIRSGKAELGAYTLRADRAGTVLNDDFRQGQRVAAGEPLMQLAEEDELWVEARLPAAEAIRLPVGTPAVVQAGDLQQEARVIQQAHTIDEQTRTRVVRLGLKNAGHRLHPGLFVDVHFELDTGKPVLAVGEGALMRSPDGDWVVFVQQADGSFKPQEVELGRALGPWREIHGVRPGTAIVQQGAFFVASELAKSGFDPHNH